MTIFHRIIILSLAVYAGACGSDQTGRVSFNEDIRPIFNQKCLRCHGGVKANGDFSLLFEEDAYQKTQSGSTPIVPGNHRKSELYKRLVHHDPEVRMPFEKAPLSAKEINLIARWIDQGAHWEKHWAYIPPALDITPPHVETARTDITGIDQFIIDGLMVRNLSIASEADKSTLLRRVYLDLIGLVPSIREIETFMSEQTPDAYEDLVDQLLASPHFGERWASMWLDLARYADTKGYEKDQNRQIWKFRDYVIESFNSDKPFDQFTIEQLAGDLIPDPSEEQLIATAFHRNSISNDEGGTDDEEFRIASVIERVSTTYEVWQSTTMACVQCHSHPYDPFRHQDFYQSMAYFNNAVDRDNYNENPKLYTYISKNEQEVKTIIDDLYARLTDYELPARTGSLFKQKEAIFKHLQYRTTEAEDFTASSPFIEIIWPEMDMLWQTQDSSWVKFDQIDLTAVEKIGFLAATELDHAGSISVHLDSLNGQKIGEVKITKTGRWEGWEGNKPPRKELLREFITKTLPIAGVHDLFFRFWVGDTYIQHLFYVDKINYYEKNALYKKLGKEGIAQLRRLAEIPATSTPIIQELPPQNSRNTFVFDRGSWMSPSNVVTAAIPTILADPKAEDPPDRLAFAEWLVNKRNPLTARVIVNRIWEQIFGRGIVETMEEFGTQGEMPTHPALLDWLANKLMFEYRWQLKPLIREIVLSATYRQSSDIDSLRLEIDPDNRWLSRGARVRLSSEQIRDQILTVSTLLNDNIGGPSVIIPELNISESFTPSWALTDEKNQFRRSLYIFWKRTDPFANMIAFDSPDRTTCTSRRIRTNTPLQALNLLNDQTYLQASFALAQKMFEKNRIEDQISDGYKRITCRPVGSERLSLLSQLYQESLVKYEMGLDLPDMIQETDYSAREKNELAALTLVANVLFNLDEFIVKN